MGLESGAHEHFHGLFIRQGGAGIGRSIWEVVCLKSLILCDALQKCWIVRGEVGGTWEILCLDFLGQPHGT